MNTENKEKFPEPHLQEHTTLLFIEDLSPTSSWMIATYNQLYLSYNIYSNPNSLALFQRVQQSDESSYVKAICPEIRFQ